MLPKQTSHHTFEKTVSPILSLVTITLPLYFKSNKTSMSQVLDGLKTYVDAILIFLGDAILKICQQRIHKLQGNIQKP